MACFLPSQIVIRKDLRLIFQILAEQSVVTIDNALGPPRNFQTNRSYNQPIAINSLQNKSQHKNYLSLMNRYNALHNI